MYFCLFVLLHFMVLLFSDCCYFYLFVVFFPAFAVTFSLSGFVIHFAPTHHDIITFPSIIKRGFHIVNYNYWHLWMCRRTDVELFEKVEKQNPTESRTESFLCGLELHVHPNKQPTTHPTNTQSQSRGYFDTFNNCTFASLWPHI